MLYFLKSSPAAIVIYIVALVIIVIIVAIYLCYYYGQRPRVYGMATAEGPVVTTFQMPPVTGNQNPGMEMNVMGGGVWPAGAGPQQQQYMNGAFAPPPYPGPSGPYGQVPTMPYPAPSK